MAHPQGASRIEEAIRRRRREGQAALIPFLTAGDGGATATWERIEAAVEAGADLLELGLPFSDPVADGPVLQAASQRALAAGWSLSRTWELAQNVRRQFPHLPVVVLTYLNPVYQRGYDAFCREAKEGGVDGLLVVDLSLEESGPLREVAHRWELALLPFAAPTTSPSRLAQVAQVAEGFVYAVARLGVTGAQEDLAATAQRVVEGVRRVTSVPVAVGFGIGSPKAAAQAATAADAVIVGSALAQGEDGRPLAADGVLRILKAMRQAMDEAGAGHEGAPWQVRSAPRAAEPTVGTVGPETSNLGNR